MNQATEFDEILYCVIQTNLCLLTLGEDRSTGGAVVSLFPKFEIR